MATTPKKIILHTGYQVTLPDEVIELIKKKFPEEHVPDIDRDHITAVHHMKTTDNGWKKELDNANQIKVNDWYESHHKKADIQCHLRKLYTDIDISRDKKGEIKRVHALVVAHVTIASSHYYLNIYNDTAMRPISVKANLNAHPELYVVDNYEDKPLPLSATVYKKEQDNTFK
jgi:hypothetical protein